MHHHSSDSPYSASLCFSCKMSSEDLIWLTAIWWPSILCKSGPCWVSTSLANDVLAGHWSVTFFHGLNFWFKSPSQRTTSLVLNCRHRWLDTAVKASPVLPRHKCSLPMLQPCLLQRFNACCALVSPRGILNTNRRSPYNPPLCLSSFSLSPT